MNTLPLTNMNDVATASQILKQSGILGTKNEGDLFLIVATCFQTGMSLLEFSQTYHMVQGRPTMKADAMLAKLLQNGGTYKIIHRTPEVASVWMKYKETESEFTFSWIEAQAEKFPYMKGGKSLKDNWASPRGRMQMLWARVVSDGVRAICPIVNHGTYTPEEVQDFDHNKADVIDMPAKPEAPVTVEPVPTQATPPPPVANPEPVVQSQIQEAEVIQNQPAPDVFQAAQTLDYSICPVGDANTKGKKWEIYQTSHLQAALRIPNLESGYINFINQLITSRGGK